MWWQLKHIIVLMVMVVVLGFEGEIFSQVIGTPARTEVEAKFALESLSRDASKKFTKDLFYITKKMIPHLSFGQKAYCTLRQDRRPTSFAFVDDYLDTSDGFFWHNNASYRLRRRWNPYHHYVRHELFPLSSLFPPIRVEIQAKTGYKPAGWHQLSVTETRLEFRKESSPFNEGFPLPSLRDPVEKFLSMARSGEYEKTTIYPYFMLQQSLDWDPKTKPVDVVVSLLSKRHRYHLRCKHPLGTGPNPDEIFIITVDQITCLKGCCLRKEMMEVEIERERNTSTTLEAFEDYESSPHLIQNPIAEKAFDYTQKLRQAYKQDHLQLRRGVHGWLLKNDYNPLAPSSKYRRFHCVEKST